MLTHQQLGQAGEWEAALYLLHRDYHILERNWRSHPHEIDLIAEQYGEIVFVEVKTRSTDQWETPEAAVDAAKQYRLSQAALHYLRSHGLHDAPFRFDIIALIGEKPPFKCQHFKYAFPLRHSPSSSFL